MNNLKLAVLVISLSVMVGVRAAETDSILTLEHCIEETLANNAAVRNAANNTTFVIVFGLNRVGVACKVACNSNFNSNNLSNGNIQI